MNRAQYCAAPVPLAHLLCNRPSRRRNRDGAQMTRRDEVIRMARDAGFDPGTPAIEDWLERFAALVAKAERERCALMCEGLYATGGFHPMLRRGSIRSAEAIRAMNDEVTG